MVITFGYNLYSDGAMYRTTWSGGCDGSGEVISTFWMVPMVVAIENFHILKAIVLFL